MSSKLILLSLIILGVYTVDPGLVATIKEALVEQVTQKVVPQIAAKFSDITVPNQSSDHCDLSEIKGKIGTVQANTLKINFDQSHNALGVTVSNLPFAFSMHFHCHESFLSVSGDASADGPISLTTSLDLTTADAGNSLFVPQISVPSMDIGINKNSFNIHISCHNCPGFVEDAIESLIKDYALPDGVKEAEKSLPGQITSQVNPVLASSFPKTEPIPNYDMSISTALTGAPVVKSDHIEVPIDGVAFRTSSGYSRTGTPAALPGLSKDLSELLQLELSSFVLNSAFDVAKQIGIPLNLNFQNYTIKGVLDKTYDTTVNFESGMIKFSGATDLDICKLGSDTKLGSINSDLNAFLQATSQAPVSDTDAMSVKVQLKNLSFNTLVLVWGSTTFDLTWVKWPINMAVWLATWFISYEDINEVLEVAKFSFSAISLMKSELFIKSKYASIGADVDFTGNI